MKHLALPLYIALAPAASLAQETQEERDVGWIQGLIEDNLSATGREVIIEGFEGALSSQATIAVMTIADDEGVWFRAEGLVLDWTRSAILGGEISVQEMSADVIEFIRPPVPADVPPELPDPEATPFEFALPELPVSIQIDAIEADRIVLGAPLLGEELAFRVDGTVSLSGGEGAATITATRLDGAEGQFEIAGAYSNETRILDLSTVLSEAEGGIVARALSLPGTPSVDLSLIGTATIDDYAADLAIATAGIDRITGSFGFLSTDAGQDVQLDIRGDINALIETDYADFFGPDVRLALQGNRDAEGALNLQELLIEAQSLTLSGNANIGADGWPEDLSLQGQIAASDGSPVVLPTGGDATLRGATIDLTFDGGAGDFWTLDLLATDYVQPGLSLPEITLNGSGIISQGASRVDGNLTYGARGLSLADAALSEAIGADITGEIAFVQEGDTPFAIPTFTITGPGLELAAEATFATGEEVVIDTSILLEANNLERFGALTGLADLNGAADMIVIGSVRPLSGMFDLTVFGNTNDLALGITALDPQIGGQGELVIEASRDTDGTRIDNLSLTTDEITASATADITSTVSAAQFDVAVREAGLSVPDLSGPLSLTGTANVSPDFSADLDTLLTLPGTTAQISASAAAPDQGGLVTLDVTTQIDDIAPYGIFAGREIAGGADLTITGTVARDVSRADLTIAGETTDLQLDVAQLDGLLRGTTTLEGRVRQLNVNAQQIEGLRLSNAQMTLGADAAITLGDLSSDIDLALTDTRDVLPSLSGPATLVGRVNRTAEGLVSTDLTATGPGRMTAMLQAELDSNDPALPANGAVDLQVGQLSVYSDLVGEPLGGAVNTQITGDIGSVAAPLDAPFAAALALAGSDLRFGDRSLTGAIEVRGDVANDADGVLAANLTAQGPGSADINLVGTLMDGAQATGELRANIDDLAPYSALAGRQLAGSLRTDLSGGAAVDGSAFDIDFDMTGRDLNAGGIALAGGVDLDGRAARAVSGQTDIMLSGIAPGNTAINLQASGLDQLETVLDVEIGNLSTYAGLIGQPLSGSMRAQIDGSVRPEDAMFDLAVSASSQNLDPGIEAVATLLRGSGQISGQVQRAADGSLAIQGLNLAYPNISAQADLASRDGGGSGTFSVRLADLGLFVSDFSGPATAAGTAQLLSGGGYGLDISATGPGGLTADVAGQIAASGTLDLTVSGGAPLALANSFIEPRRISGDATFDLAINGPPALSSVSGRIGIGDGRLATPTFGQALEQLGGSVLLTGQSATLDLGGTLEDGGRITASGPVGLGGSLDANLRVAGQGLVLRDPSLYETTVDALITIVGPLTGGALIAGQIDLGPTEIQVPSSSTSALGPLPQVTHIGAPAAVQQTLDRAGLTLGGVDIAAQSGASGPVFGLDLLISAPARVFIRGRGLDAELGGQLQISGTTAQVIPIGEFSLIRGRLDILEQRFELDEGGAFLQGSFNPFLRLVASTEARDGTEVRIIVEGPAAEPEVRFESSPDLPQDEVLSRLIFGRDLASISPLQAIQLASAVSTLAGRSSGGLLSDFRQGLGLDDLDVTTDEEGNTAVRAGAYISDNVYTDVTVGSENTEINLNLDLTDDITVTGSAGSDGNTSVGIFFERDY